MGRDPHAVRFAIGLIAIAVWLITAVAFYSLGRLHQMKSESAWRNDHERRMEQYKKQE